MSSSKFILKCMRAVMLSHWSAQKESCLDVRSFKGLNTIYENISRYYCKVISFCAAFDLKYVEITTL